jgi:phosphate transport system permease protein
MRKRRIKQNLFIAVCGASALTTALILVVILGFIFLKGAGAINANFLMTPEFSSNGLTLGIANAIAGTVLLSMLSIVIATPFSIGVAIYLAEYSHDNALTKTLRFLIDLLAGMPAIVLGMIGFILLVWYMKFFTGGFSLIAGAISLAVLVFPTIARSSEEALKRTPNSIKEVGYALGNTRWGVIKTIVIPYSLPGIITGVVLGIGRAAEESAVIALTAGYSQHLPALEFFHREGVFMSTKVAPFQKEVGSLPIAIFESYVNPDRFPMENVFATAIVLIFIVLGINLVAKVISRKYGFQV